jgi:hypothetical protein
LDYERRSLILTVAAKAGKTATVLFYRLGFVVEGNGMEIIETPIVERALLSIQNGTATFHDCVVVRAAIILVRLNLFLVACKRLVFEAQTRLILRLRGY